jgi:hypothetical protein
MRCWAMLMSSAVALFLTPAWGQRGGHGGMAGGGHPVMAAHSAAGVRGLSRTTVVVSTFGTGFRRPFVFPHRPFGNRFFFSGGWPWWYYGYDWYPYPLAGYPAYDYSTADYGQTRDLSGELERLSDEVMRLRQEQEDWQSRQSASAPQQKAEQEQHPTVLVFGDQHRQEVQNYAIVGPTLWILDAQRATKLPLSSLDIEATTKANEERGVQFRVPRQKP